LGIKTDEEKSRKALKALTIPQLKYLAKSHGARVKGTVSEGLFDSSYSAPSKQKYVNKLATILKDTDIQRELAKMPKPEKKKRRRQRSSWW
jgi:hypothetical protein